MRAIVGILIAAALVFASGCAQKDWIDRTLVTVDVTGTWKSDSGWELNLEQDGSRVKGFVRHGLIAPSMGPRSDPLEGTVAGDVFTFRNTRADVEGELTISGDDMTGTMSRQGGPGDTLGVGSRGTVSLRRVERPSRPALPPR